LNFTTARTLSGCFSSTPLNSRSNFFLPVPCAHSFGSIPLPQQSVSQDMHLVEDIGCIVIQLRTSRTIWTFFSARIRGVAAAMTSGPFCSSSLRTDAITGTSRSTGRPTDACNASLLSAFAWMA
jgi:hypothetical protein